MTKRKMRNRQNKRNIKGREKGWRGKRNKVVKKWEKGRALWLDAEVRGPTPGHAATECPVRRSHVCQGPHQSTAIPFRGTSCLHPRSCTAVVSPLWENVNMEPVLFAPPTNI